MIQGKRMILEQGRNETKYLEGETRVEGLGGVDEKGILRLRSSFAIAKLLLRSG